jgi:hypothetical protein
MRLAKYAGKQGHGEFRPMTLDEVKQLSYDDHVWFVSVQGDAKRAKVNGRPRTWKRDSTRIELPIKYGLYEYATFDAADIAAGRILIELEEVR